MAISTDTIVSHLAVTAVGGGVIAAVTQSDLTLWAAGLTVIGGAVLYLLDRHRRNVIETSTLERESILRDAKADMRDAKQEVREVRLELHNVRDELNKVRIQLAVTQAMDKQPHLGVLTTEGDAKPVVVTPVIPSEQ